MNGPYYVRYFESIVVPRVWMQEVPAGALH